MPTRRGPAMLAAVTVLGVAGCGSASSASTSSAPAGPAQTITIGNLQALTGSYAAFGESNTAAVDIAVKEINSGGGFVVNGKKYQLNVITVDDASTPTGATAGSLQLIRDDHANFIFGAESTPTSTAEQTVTAPNHVAIFTASFVLSDALSSPSLDPQYKKYTFGVGSTTTNAVAAQVSGIAKLMPGMKTVALLFPDQASYDAEIPDYAAAFQRAGMTMVAYRFPATTTDFSSILTKVKAQNPDVILAGASLQPIDAIALQMINLGIKPKIYFGSGGDSSTGLTANSGNPLPFPYAYNAAWVDPLVAQGAAKVFYDKLSAALGHGNSSPNGAYVYTPVKMLVAAMQAANSVTDTDKIISKLTHVQVPGLIGNYSFNANHQANFKIAICTVIDVKVACH